MTVSGERIAKAMARAGLCSRREAEGWIEAGRVSVNGTVLETPAFTVTQKDKVIVDGKPLRPASGPVCGSSTNHGAQSPPTKTLRVVRLSLTFCHLTCRAL